MTANNLKFSYARVKEELQGHEDVFEQKQVQLNQIFDVNLMQEKRLD